MIYGRTDEPLANIDFTLPPIPDSTIKTLTASNTDEPLKIYIGAPKWGERSWKGKIYPKRAKDNELLRKSVV